MLFMLLVRRRAAVMSILSKVAVDYAGPSRGLRVFPLFKVESKRSD